METEIEVTGTADSETASEVLRNLRILYNTRAGEQALDRDFGLDASIMDHPSAAARSLYTAEFVRKTERYEPRAQVQRVEWQGDAAQGSMKAKVVVRLV